jgi:hypothetical protein
MNILLVHQNFPGQYRELFRWLIAQRRHNVVFLTQRKDVTPIEGAEIVVYQPHHKAAKDAYALSSYWEDCVGNGYGAAQACETLKHDGFHPDIILGHVGWGELTFVKQVWPDVPVIGLFEYFFRAEGGSVGIRPRVPGLRSGRLHDARAQRRELRQYPDRRPRPCAHPLAARHVSRKLPPQALRRP